MKKFFDKGVLLSESFSILKYVPNHLSDHYPPKEKNAKDIELVCFLEDGVKVKNYLRLSHLYTPNVLKLRMKLIIFLCQLSYILAT